MRRGLSGMGWMQQFPQTREADADGLPEQVEVDAVIVVHDEVSGASGGAPRRIGEASRVCDQQAVDQAAHAVHERFEGKWQSRVSRRGVSTASNQLFGLRQGGVEVVEPAGSPLVGRHSDTASAMI